MSITDTETKNAFLGRIRRKAALGGMARAQAESELRRADPVLTLLCQIEAMGDERVFLNESPYSRLYRIRDFARAAIEHITNEADNPIFPVKDAGRDDPWGLRSKVIRNLKGEAA